MRAPDEVNPADLRFGKCLVGTPWRMEPSVQSALDTLGEDGIVNQMSQAARNCVQIIPTDENEAMDVDLQKERAREMLVCLLWDPSSRVKGRPRFPLLELPMLSECSGADMLLIIGFFMKYGGDSIKCMTFDNHESHRLLRATMLGLHAPKPHIPWFGELEFESLPHCCLLKFNYNCPMFQGQYMWALNGVHHLAKNLANAIRTCVRTIQIGSYFVDVGSALDLGLPPAPYCGWLVV